jgi:nickel/cobalt transporter (NiCoT) family protein
MNIDGLGAPFLTTLGLAALLGFRHGFDADHIAVVDGMTRARQLHRSYWTARWVGLQFAAGHSLTIMVAALLLFGQGAALPAWLDGLGVIISTVLLLVIACSNLAHALSPAASGIKPMGPVAALLFRLTGRELHPALVGVAFALSLDSLAQAALFASHGGSVGAAAGVAAGAAGAAGAVAVAGVAAVGAGAASGLLASAASGGIAAVAALAAAFGAGMVAADAGNGLLLAWFSQRSDRLAQQASRWSSAFIALIALATAGAVLLRQTQTGFAQAWESAGVWTGVGLMGLTSLVFVLRLMRQRARAAHARA